MAITTTAGGGLSASGLDLLINTGASISATDGQALDLSDINLTSPVSFTGITSSGSTSSASPVSGPGSTPP